jgi:hypothetical protein
MPACADKNHDVRGPPAKEENCTPGIAPPIWSGFVWSTLSIGGIGLLARVDESTVTSLLSCLARSDGVASSVMLTDDMSRALGWMVIPSRNRASESRQGRRGSAVLTIRCAHV